jgi:hypothetical protein
MPEDVMAAPTTPGPPHPESNHDAERPPTDRFMRRLASGHWERVAGELFLIVVGVLIGLGVNNWNSRRQQRQLEITVLREFRAALASDLAALREVKAAVQLRETRMETLRTALERGVVPTASADQLFGAVLRVWELQLNRSVYETLKAKGLDLISSESVRLGIAALYENAYVNLDQSQADDRSVVFEVVRPYYLKNFRAIRFGDSATPLSYVAVTRDPYFRNLLDYRLASLRANPIKSVEVAIKRVSALTESIDAALAHGQ